MDEQNSRVGGKRPRAGSDSSMTGLAESKRVTRFDEVTADLNEGRARPRPRSVDTAEEDSPEVRTHEIRAEIEQTREDMSETVNAIQERLRPGAIAARTAETVKQAAVETVREVADSDSVQYVRANPIPTVMVGVGIAGLAWLATRGNNGRSSRRSYLRGRVIEDQARHEQRCLPNRRRLVRRRVSAGNGQGISGTAGFRLF